MNTNQIKTAIAAASTVVAVGASVRQFMSRRKTAVIPTEPVAQTLSPEFIAFNAAQDIISERMLAGYYDDKTNAEVRHDFAVLYANILTD